MVVAVDGADLSTEYITRAVAPQLAGSKHPRHVVFPDALPRNATGKVQNNRLRKTHADMFRTRPECRTASIPTLYNPNRSLTRYATTAGARNHGLPV